MLRVFSLAALVTAGCSQLGDFTPPPEPACPHLQIKASETIPAGARAEVWVKVLGAGPPPAMHWSVTSGAIASGQDTDTILIDTTGLAGTTLRATVELSGLPAECQTREATTFVLVGPPLQTSAR